jgi:hypothetical protein
MLVYLSIILSPMHLGFVLLVLELNLDELCIRAAVALHVI